MIYKAENMKRDVRVCLEHNNISAPLFDEGDPDTLSLDEVIESKLAEAVDLVHGLAPAHLLEEGHNFGQGGVYWGDQGSGMVLLPLDFMRLVSFEMSDWERCAGSAISTDSPEYALQRQRVKALRGTPQRPVCAIAVRPEGKVLEFYSCKDESAYVRRAHYVPYAAIDEYGGIDISPRCYRAAVYVAASLVSTTLGDTEKSQAMLGVAKSLLQLQ